MCILGNHRRRWLHIRALLSVTLTIAGCVPPSTTAGTARSGKTITEIPSVEIEAERGRFSTAYDMIRTLRPSMLVGHDVARGAQSPTTIRVARRGIKVYMDGLPYGGLESLATIPAASVLEVRWLSASEATTRFGTGNASGAILVSSRTGRW